VDPIGAVFPVVRHEEATGGGEDDPSESVVEAPARNPNSLLLSVPSDHVPILSLLQRPFVSCSNVRPVVMPHISAFRTHRMSK